MTETVTSEDLLTLRVRALGLASMGLAGVRSGETPGPERITDVARNMLALQGQDWRSSRWALGLRAPGTTVDDVYTAFNEHRIVRSWPMRGTIHVVAAEDIGWMQRATNHRVLAGASQRREFLGLDTQTLDRLVDTSMRALAGSNGLNRDELAAVWTEAGIEWQSNWRYHVIWWLCQNGYATFGPVRGEAEPLLVSAAEWITEPRSVEGDDALIELAVRYASARGPIRERDLAWWTGLTVREARRGIELAAESGRLQSLRLTGDSAGALWADPEALGTPANSGPAVPEWLMLPSFDEHLLGYTDRAAQLDPQHFDHIVPGRNGMFLATVVRRGRVVGTWRRATGKRVRIELSPLPKARLNRRALAPELTKWARFHGHDDAAFA